MAFCTEIDEQHSINSQLYVIGPTDRLNDSSNHLGELSLCHNELEPQQPGIVSVSGLLWVCMLFFVLVLVVLWLFDFLFLLPVFRSNFYKALLDSSTLAEFKNVAFSALLKSSQHGENRVKMGMVGQNSIGMPDFIK